jgi:biopolymer transport protein ExbD
MANKEKRGVWNAAELRTRYLPKSRIGQGLISVAPWVNLALLMFCFLMLDSKLVLQPGVVINLPKGPFKEGTGFEMVAAVLSVQATGGGGREEIIFFNDLRYRVGNEEQMKKLKQAFAMSLREHHDASLIVQADQRVPQGTVVEIMNMALEVGIKQINIATRPF